ERHTPRFRDCPMVSVLKKFVANSKVLWQKKLTSRELLLPTELRVIILAAVARYAAFGPIHDASGDPGTLASDQIKYFPRSLHTTSKLFTQF
ncbi:Hypothetical protein FKW44_003114, partial [Caligus rogercresseyi]